ncbi:Ig-specific serine endopeptidase MIP, partial [Mesomycoplasma ovipneumoniae]|uniref:Ig-specific serine endopeptidase MIP n=1 Tax=Mesomycoplasma ovipneumoniae TaxID=29562 RepID=UPI000B2A3B6A
VAHEAHPSHNNNPLTRTNFSFGTLGILDYQIPQNNTYPLKWFFLTNGHVVNNLQIANDFHKDKHYGRDISNYNDSDLRLNTQSITLTKLKQTVPLNTILPTSRNASTGDEYYNTVKLDIKEKNGRIYNNGLESPNLAGVVDQSKPRQKPTQSMNVRTILMGSDVFKFKPSDFTDQQDLQNVDEFLDFAIIEINFNNEWDAKQITEEFYNNHKSNSLKISEFNPFNSDQYSKLEKTPFYSLGYPGSKGDPTISQNNYPTDFALREYSVSPWINKNFRLFNSTNENDPLINGGSEFSWSRSYRSFVNIPGISDYFITAPVMANSFTKLDYFDQTDKQRKSKKYLNGGLGTVIDNYTASGGLSGSPVFFKDGQLYSVVYASDSQASANLTLNLRSYGYDYKGYYGKYNLPKYDLIYGDTSSDAQQQKSYWKALAELYKNETNFKTNLFPEGLSKQKDVFTKNN